MTGDVTTDVAVVGGGLAGLAAATVAARAGARVVVVERGSLGGRAITDERDGFLLNRGGHALYAGGEAEAVLGRLGVKVTGGRPPLAGALGLYEGRTGLLPGNTRTLLRTRLLGLRAKGAVARFLTRLAKLDPVAMQGVTVDAWLADADLPPVADGLVRMLVRTATYTHAPHLVDAGATVAQLQRALGPGVRYLDGGWASLVSGLADAAGAAGVATRQGAAAPGGVDGDGVTLADGTRVRARSVVLAAGPPAAAGRLLAGGPPLAWADLGPEVVASCLDLGLASPPVHPVLLGIDVPVYCIAHHPAARLTERPGASVVHLMRYLAPEEQPTADETRAQLAAHARRAGVGHPVVERYLHRMVVAGAHPLASRGGLQGRAPVEVHDGVLVAGDWVGGEGLLADAALASAERAGRMAAQAALAAPVTPAATGGAVRR